MQKYFISFLFFFTFIAKAQTVLENQFQFNYLALNPAFAGAKDAFSLNAMLGNQFNGTGGRPQQIYQLFSMDGPIQQGSGGLALQAFNSSVAGLNKSGAKIAYAYGVSLTDNLAFRLGVDGGFIYQPTIVSGLGLKQMFPYAGLGGLLHSETYFVSISKPILLINNDGLFLNKKPLYTMVGGSLGELEGTMINLSAMYEMNKGLGSDLFLNGKVWFAQKLGVGVSYQMLKSYSTKVNKIVPMVEYQVAPSFRLGASYDPKPTSFTSSSTAVKQRGILQIYLRYEPRQDDREVSRLKYY